MDDVHPDLPPPAGRQHLLRRARTAITVLILAALVGWSLGCTAVVRGPAGPVAEPVTVFVTFDDRHRGLLLPRGTLGWVEYGFGEYAWYAEKRDAWYRAFPAVLWPTGGTLGRRELPAVTLADLRATLPWMTLRPLIVERDNVTRVLAELDEAFVRGRDVMVEDMHLGKHFVRADESYWCCFNCNDALARWLMQLGCTVSWVPLRLDITIR